ncbi:MAG: hypothetical protein R6U44_09165 [Archaeoglobaceae archaeon]
MSEILGTQPITLYSLVLKFATFEKTVTIMSHSALLSGSGVHSQ